MSVTPDRITTNKKSLPEIRKIPKNYHGDKVSDPKNKNQATI